MVLKTVLQRVLTLLNRRCHHLMVLPLLMLGSVANATTEVVATTTSLAMLAREIGGNRVDITTLAPPDRDIHYLQAKPSMILALRNADLLVLVGAELEVGWLPAALSSSTNATIQPGAAGYFEAAAHTTLIDQSKADRSLGDVHPQGNPHFSLDPLRMAEIGKALAERLAVLAPDDAKLFRQNAATLSSKLEQLAAQLKTRAKGASGALLMHRSADYLMALLEVPVLGYMEPVPGIPPTAAHISQLSTELSQRKGVIIHAPYHQDQAAKLLENTLGWQRFVFPIEPPKGARFPAYQVLLEQWANALASTLPQS